MVSHSVGGCQALPHQKTKKILLKGISYSPDYFGEGMKSSRSGDPDERGTSPYTAANTNQAPYVPSSDLYKNCRSQLEEHFLFSEICYLPKSKAKILLSGKPLNRRFRKLLAICQKAASDSVWCDQQAEYEAQNY
jgi:hypothetical protein